VKNPEFPFLLAGTVAVIGGAAREGRWPKNGVKAVAATLVLVLIVSTLKGTAFGRLAGGIGWLLVMGAVYTAVPALNASTAKRKKG